MALQGTLDTFELPDVLRLLASTKKSGRLHLRSDRGDGSVWLTDGKVVGVRSDGTGDGEPADALFDMLRAHEGSFAFELGEEAAETISPPFSVEPLLAAAEERLAEWREIEAVVPSLRAWVALASELPAPELTIDAATWKVITGVGSGLTVGELGRSMELGEVGVSRLVRDLVVLGVGVVTTEPAAAPAPSWGASASSWSSVATDDVGFEPMPVGDELAPGTDVDDGDDFAATGFTADDPSGLGVEPMAEPEVDLPVPAETYGTGEDDDPSDEEADEVARQLAMLSPRAAQAVAAAAAAETDAERDAALEVLDESEEPINRGLLLKFLSSVKG